MIGEEDDYVNHYGRGEGKVLPQLQLICEQGNEFVSIEEPDQFFFMQTYFNEVIRLLRQVSDLLSMHFMVITFKYLQFG